MSTCARCGHELGVGRFCTNCGHPIGQPVPESEVLPRLDEAPPTEAPDRPAPAGGPPWLLAVVGGALVLLLVVVLASCLGGDDDPADTPDSRSDSHGADAEAGTGAEQPRPTNVAGTARVDAPEAAPLTTDLDGSTVGFAAAADGRRGAPDGVAHRR